jgi:hypothetical protein
MQASRAEKLGFEPEQATVRCHIYPRVVNLGWVSTGGCVVDSTTQFYSLMRRPWLTTDVIHEIAPQVVCADVVVARASFHLASCQVLTGGPVLYADVRGPIAPINGSSAGRVHVLRSSLCCYCSSSGNRPYPTRSIHPVYQALFAVWCGEIQWKWSNG